jgi:segregation and condensation protein B
MLAEARGDTDTAAAMRPADETANADGGMVTAETAAAPADEMVSLASLGLDQSPGAALPDSDGDAGALDDLEAIVEALVFASPEPLSVKALAKVLDGEARDHIARVLTSLRQDYERHGGLQLIEVAGGYQIVTRPDLNEWVRRLFHERKSTKLSVAALETLAVIAYRQPVTAAEIAEIRGVNTSGVLATLVERKLIKIAGRKNVVGRPFLYATTREFLLRFGLNDVSDLPRVEEMADALGFDLPAALGEPMPSDQFLPLGEPEDAALETLPDHEVDGEDAGPEADGEAGE